MKQKLLTSFADFREITESGLNTVENVFLLLATRAAPWAAPLGPAYMIYRAVIHRLAAPHVAAAAMGIAVELVGIACSHLAIRCWQWNQTKRKTDPEAPASLAAWMTGLYLAGAVCVSTLLEVWPEFSAYVPVVFFALALAAYVSLALGSQLSRWETARASEATARRDAHDMRARIVELGDQAAKLRADNERLQRQVENLKATKATQRAANSEPVILRNGNPSFPIDEARAAKASKVAARRARIAALLSDDPNLSNAELGRRLGVSADTVRRDRATFEPDGPEVVDVLRAAMSGLNAAVNGNGRHE